jgi:putative membrane protein
MRTPLIAGLKPLMTRKSCLGISLLVLYSYLIEFVGLKTGWPYGSFEYLVSLGPHLSGVPLGLPLFFIPLVLNSFIFASLLEIRPVYRKILFAISTVLVIDLILDPAAVSLGLWSYSSGTYYGVPASNFLGWILSATVATLLIHFSFDAENLTDRIREADFILDDLVSFVLLWGIVNLYYLNLIPVLLTLAVITVLWRSEKFDLATDIWRS